MLVSEEWSHDEKVRNVMSCFAVDSSIHIAAWEMEFVEDMESVEESVDGGVMSDVVTRYYYDCCDCESVCVHSIWSESACGWQMRLIVNADCHYFHSSPHNLLWVCE